MEKNNIISLIKGKYIETKKEVFDFNKNVLKNKEFGEITELHMHKILYFLFGYFWKEYKKELFSPDFEAWKYGPIEINYRNNELEKFDDLSLDKNELKFIDGIIFGLLKYDVWSLVDESHKTSPWINNFDENVEHIKIDKEEIKKYFEAI